MTNPPETIAGPRGRLACRRRAGLRPGVVWLGGFKSDMRGTKAEFLDRWAADRGRAFLRFDYSGHGESEGAFEDGSIGEWSEDALAVFDALSEGPQILVGSSMGGWIATLLALKRPERIAGIVFVAPAPDFTEELIWAQMSAAERETLTRKGRIEQPSDYGEAPHVITKKLIEDGRRNLVLAGPIPITAPVRVLQGMADADVPWRHAMRLVEALDSDDVEITLVKTGDHRLSSPADLDRIAAALDGLSNR